MTKSTTKAFNLSKAISVFNSARDSDADAKVSLKAAKTALRNGAALLCKTEKGREDVKNQNDNAKGAGLASLVSECAFYYALPADQRGKPDADKDLAAHIHAVYAAPENKAMRLRTNLTKAYRYAETLLNPPLSACDAKGALKSLDAVRKDSKAQEAILAAWGEHCDAKDVADAERENAASANVASGTVLQSIETLTDTQLLALQDAVAAEIERRAELQIAA